MVGVGGGGLLFLVWLVLFGPSIMRSIVHFSHAIHFGHAINCSFHPSPIP
jgi:hypothetical protein